LKSNKNIRFINNRLCGLLIKMDNKDLESEVCRPTHEPGEKLSKKVFAGGLIMGLAVVAAGNGLDNEFITGYGYGVFFSDVALYLAYKLI